MSKLRWWLWPRSPAQISIVAVRQTEGGDRRLGPADHLLEQRRALLGRREGEDLDLVELVRAQQAPGVAPGRAGLATEARRRRHQPHRQVASARISSRYSDVSGTSAVGMHHRSSRSMAKASSANFGQLPARRQRRRRDERRRAHLLEGVGVAVEGQLAQRPTERRPEATRHGEHRPTDLDRPLVVEDPELGADLPVRHALVLGERLGHVERAADDPVVARPTPRRGRRGGSGSGSTRRTSRRASATLSCSSASAFSSSPSCRLSA